MLRAYYKSFYLKQYEKADRLLRTETCLNDTYHLAIGRKLDNLSAVPAIKQHLAAPTDRYLAQQAELLDSTVDRGALTTLAVPVTTGTGRVPGIKLHEDRLIRVLDSLLYTGPARDWTIRQLHARFLARHRLGEDDYTLGQLRYDLGKLCTHGLVERVGRRWCYRLTPDGVRLGALLVKVRTRLLGPIFADPALAPKPRSKNPSTGTVLFEPPTRPLPVAHPGKRRRLEPHRRLRFGGQQSPDRQDRALDRAQVLSINCSRNSFRLLPGLPPMNKTNPSRSSSLRLHPYHAYS